MYDLSPACTHLLKELGKLRIEQKFFNLTTAIVEMLQTNLAFEQLQAEKQHLDEENEIQAISK